MEKEKRKNSEKPKREDRGPKPKLVFTEFITKLLLDNQKRAELLESKFTDTNAIIEFLLEQAAEDMAAGNTSGFFRIKTHIKGGRSIYVVYTYDALQKLVNSPKVNRGPTEYASILLTSQTEGYDAVLAIVDRELYEPMSKAILEFLKEITNKKDPKTGLSTFGPEVTSTMDRVFAQAEANNETLNNEHFTQIAAETILGHVFPNKQWQDGEAVAFFNDFNKVVKAVGSSTILDPLFGKSKEKSAKSTEKATKPFKTKLKSYIDQETLLHTDAKEGSQIPYKAGIVTRLYDSHPKVGKDDVLQTTATLFAASIETVGGALSEVYNQFAMYPETFYTLKEALFKAEARDENGQTNKADVDAFNQMMESFIYHTVGIVSPAAMSLKLTHGVVDMGNGNEIPEGEAVIMLNKGVVALDRENFPDRYKASLNLTREQKQLVKAAYLLAPEASAKPKGKAGEHAENEKAYNHQCKGLYYSVMFLWHIIVHMLKYYERPILDLRYKNKTAVNPTSKRTGRFHSAKVRAA